MATPQEISWAIREGAPLTGFGRLAGWVEDKPLREHQERGVAWLYFTPKALLLDTMGVGKTPTALGYAQLLLARGEARRILFVVQAATVHGTWLNDGFRKFVPDMNYAFAGTGMTKKKRQAVYADPTWDVLLTNHESFWRDEEELLALGFDVIVWDEADVLRTKSNQSFKSMLKLATQAERVVLMTGTPLNNRLEDFHSLLVILGLDHLVGTEDDFKRMYVDIVFDKVRVKVNNRYVMKGIPRVVGHKNLEVLRTLIDPYTLRRTREDIPDSDMPELRALEKWLELSPVQEKLYRRILAAAKDDQIKDRLGLDNLYLRLRQCCTNAALVDPSLGDHSSKMDWLLARSTGEWEDEKIVLFSNWKDALALYAARLDKVGIGHVTLTSDVRHEVREDRRQQFWQDPGCKYLLGTTAIEKGLNLQNSRLQVNLDLLANPMRHEQLAGRVARSGSEFDAAFALSLFSTLSHGGKTVDSELLYIMAKKAALSGFMVGDISSLLSNFVDSLTNTELRRVLGM